MNESGEAAGLYYQVEGEGRPLVLVHGLFGMGDNLAALGRVLARGHRVYRPDLRNHGRSRHVSGMSLQSLADDFERFGAELELGDTDWLGHSLGGKALMQLALSHPQRVRRLLVADIAPASYAPGHEEIFAALGSVAPSALESRSEADRILSNKIHSRPVRQFLLKNLYPVESGFAWRFDLQALEAGYEQILKAPEGAPFSGPTLFLHGENSDYVLPQHHPVIKKLFPASDIVTLKNCGHWLHVEQPDQFHELSRDFFAD